jgi:polyphosphate kinase
MSPLPEELINRELSWLEFNQRVLDQAIDQRVPLLERLKFLAITASNLDEFFMVRVGGLWLQLRQNPSQTDPTGMTVSEQLQRVLSRCHRFRADQYRLWDEELAPQLLNAGIQQVRVREASAKHRQALAANFRDSALAILTPQLLDQSEPLPLLLGLALHLCVRLKPNPGEEVPWDYAVIPLGKVLPRLLNLPAEKGVAFTLLEEVVTAHASEFFPGREVIECVAFRLTRNADVELREDQAPDLMVGMEDVLESRRLSGFVRLEIEDRASPELVAYLAKATGLPPEYTFRNSGPLDLTVLHRITEFAGFESLRNTPWPAQSHRLIDPAESMFTNIQQHDLLVVHPYEQYDPIVRLIEEAAVDPQVLAIKQILYRTSGQSAIVAALGRAAKHGKYVTALVELKARFDEERNIEWARELELAGVQVIYGVKGLKTHAKVCVIIRREPHGMVRYCHFGTGNYNESTARFYSDVSLLTCHEELGSDATLFFNAITGASQPRHLRQLVMAPISLRRKILDLIKGETRRQTQGQRGRIMAKVNSLVDPQIIAALYQASRAGVEVDLSVRGVCCLRPGVPGLSENIRVVSTVDRYLEHARILYFYHGGQPLLWISSADWMPRNLDRRVELLIPVLDNACRQKLTETLATYFEDNVNAWELLSDGRYLRRTPAGESGSPAQQRLHQRAIEALRQARQLRRTMFQPHQPASE